MDLPTAIREGAKFRPQCREHYLKLERSLGGKFEISRSCALGAAYEAHVGKLTDYPTDEIMVALTRAWPELETPGHLKTAGRLISKIAEMNDVDGKTREEIADWLEDNFYRAQGG